MIRKNGYWILESRKEFLLYYDKSCNRLDEMSLPYGFEGKESDFPVAFRRCESPDSHCCDYLSIRPLEEAKKVIFDCLNLEMKIIQEKINALNKI